MMQFHQELFYGTSKNLCFAENCFSSCRPVNHWLHSSSRKQQKSMLLSRSSSLDTLVMTAQNIRKPSFQKVKVQLASHFRRALATFLLEPYSSRSAKCISLEGFNSGCCSRSVTISGFTQKVINTGITTVSCVQNKNPKAKF